MLKKEQQFSRRSVICISTTFQNSSSVLKLLSKLLNSSSELENLRIYNSPSYASFNTIRSIFYEYRRCVNKLARFAWQKIHPLHRTISPSFPKASTRSSMPRSHAAPFDPLIAQQTMIAKTESSVFLTGRPAKPAFNSRNFSFTCHTHNVWRRVFGDSAIVPWNGCAWHCDAFQASVHPHTRIRSYVQAHTRT